MHIFLTGASAGIGTAIARAAVAAGWRVSGCARRLDRLEALGRELGEAFLPLACDVRLQSELDAAGKRASERFGAIDGLVANAGHGLDGELLECSTEEIAGLFDTNLLGVHRSVRATRPYWSQGACLVLVSSLAAYISVPRMGAYCASKHALDAYASALRVELRDSGVRVCSVNPGTVSTEFFEVAPQAGGIWNWRPGRALAPETVARVVLRQLRRGRPRSKLLPLTASAWVWLHRRLPKLGEGIMLRALRRMRAQERTTPPGAD